MIVFDLSCSNGHSFEVWFNSNNDYKEQNDKGLLICPYCECNKISKKLSAPKIKSSNNNQKPKENLDIVSLRKKFLDYVEKNRTAGCCRYRTCPRYHRDPARRIQGTGLSQGAYRLQ